MPGARRWSRKLVGTVGGTALVILVAACGSDGGDPQPAPVTTDAITTQASSASTSDTAAIGAPAATFYNLLDACAGKPVPGAAAYAGHGPHRVAFYAMRTHSDETQAGCIVGEPEGWGGGPPYDVQLVACVASVPGPVARTCAYGTPVPETMTMDWGEYTVTLYRARTAAKVATVKIQGADDSCPTSIAAPTGY